MSIVNEVYNDTSNLLCTSTDVSNALNASVNNLHTLVGVMPFDADFEKQMVSVIEQPKTESIYDKLKNIKSPNKKINISNRKVSYIKERKCSNCEKSISRPVSKKWLCKECRKQHKCRHKIMFNNCKKCQKEGICIHDNIGIFCQFCDLDGICGHGIVIRSCKFCKFQE